VLKQYPNGQTLPSPEAIDFTPGELLGSVSGELGLREYLEKAGHELVVTSSKDGPDSVFERELVDAEVVISQPFFPAYLTADLIAKAPKLKLAITAGIGSDHVDLEAQIKLSVVVSDIFGVSGREMMAALIAGERDPRTLAEMARGRMRSKTARLVEVFIGRFSDHGFLLTTMLARIDALSADIEAVQERTEQELAPFAQAVARLDEIPVIGATAAAVIIAEIGVDMTRFPTPAHLSSWAKFAPCVKESAGRKKGNGATGHGNRYLARVLGDAAVNAGRTDTFLGERYRRIARRRGKKRAIVAVGRSILVIAWHLLSDDNAQFRDLGPGYYDSRVNLNRKMRNHVRELQALGYKVTFEAAA
jgi:hypothetical protein